MRRVTLGIALFVAFVPALAVAGAVVPGFTEVEVGERGMVTVTLTLKGPVQGPLKMGLLERGRLRSPKDLDLLSIPAGTFTPVSAELRLGRSPIGTHTVGVEGPKGMVAKVRFTILPGPRQETFNGRRGRSTTVQTYLYDRRGDLGRGYLDDTGKGVAVIFFVKIHEPGERYRVDFEYKKERVCGEVVAPAGVRGQVVKVRATCRPGDPEEAANDDIPIIDDDAALAKPIPLGGTGDGSGATRSDSTTGVEEEVLPLSKIVEKPGRWRVVVREGDQVRRILTFAVRHGKIVATGKGRAPLKPLKVRVVVP